MVFPIGAGWNEPTIKITCFAPGREEFSKELAMNWVVPWVAIQIFTISNMMRAMSKTAKTYAVILWTKTSFGFYHP
jgi:hypothetical protein